MVMQYTETVCKGNTILDIPHELVCRQNMPMGYLDQLSALRKKRGYTQATLAEQMGVEQPTIQRWERGKREPNIGQLIEMASILGVDPGALIDPSIAVAMGPSLYVKGDVAAGVWREAFELPEDEWQSFTGRADVTADKMHRFGLRIVGDSMDEIYPPGTIVECVSVFGTAEPSAGKKVVVLRINDQQEVEATVKELVERMDELWLVPRSSNPSHSPIRLKELQEGITEVRIAAVVVASVRPE